MRSVEDIWRRKTNEEVLRAVGNLADYAEEGKKVILEEAKRRGLSDSAVPPVESNKGPEGAPAVMRRYNDAYRVTNTVDLIGRFTKAVGIVFGALLALWGVTELRGQPLLIGFGAAVMIWVAFFICGTPVSAPRANP